jgi:hypothetical protein
MNMQPSQLNPFYPFHTVGLYGTATAELAQTWWGAWKAQAEPFPGPPQIIAWFPSHPDHELTDYVREVAGTAADLDTELEAAGIECLMQDNQSNEQ